MNDKQAKSKFQGSCPVKRKYIGKECRSEEKGEFSAAFGLRRR